MKRIEEIFGENLRYHRKRVGYTQDELANACDMSLGAVQLLESGKSWPNRSSVRRLCKALDASEESMFQAPDSVRAAPTAEEALSALIGMLNVQHELLKTLVPKDLRATLPEKAVDGFDSVIPAKAIPMFKQVTEEGQWDTVLMFIQGLLRKPFKKDLAFGQTGGDGATGKGTKRSINRA